MVFDAYNIVYILSNIFGTYVIYKFMMIFFTENRTNKQIEALSYVLYFLGISVIYLTFKSPIINLVSNIIIFILLTFNYEARWRLRLTSTLLIYTIMITVEAIVVLGLNYLNLNKYYAGADIELIIALISVKIVSYVVVLALSNFKMVSNNIDLSPIHWLAIFIVPIGTLYTTVLLLTQNSTYGLAMILVGVAILFVVNIFVFYLYDVLNNLYQQKLEKEMLQQQNNAFTKQFELISSAQENIRRIRHDIRNHITVLNNLIENDQKNAALEYNATILDSIKFPEKYIDSGNPEIDGILNYKIQEAKNVDIDVELRVSIPEKIHLDPFDISVILGNLLDNAIAATKSVEENRKISGIIEYKRSTVFIKMTNPYSGELKYRGNKLMTTHLDKKHHGYGLTSIQKSLDKYNGIMEIQTDANRFSVEILLYVPGDNSSK